MSVLKRVMRVSNRSLLAFIFFFSLSSSCLYFIYVAPGIGKHQGACSLTSRGLPEGNAAQEGRGSWGLGALSTGAGGFVFALRGV